jgi:predicted dehydrogenase
MADRMNLGLVGAGAIAQSYVQALRDSPVASIAGVADVRSEAARALAENARCAAFGSHKELCDATDCEAVIVCTPPVTHPEICIDLLGQGIPVLCEKPLSIDLERRSAPASSSPWPRSSATWTT